MRISCTRTKQKRRDNHVRQRMCSNLSVEKCLSFRCIHSNYIIKSHHKPKGGSAGGVLDREMGFLVSTGKPSLVLGEFSTTSIKYFTIFPPHPKNKKFLFSVNLSDILHVEYHANFTGIVRGATMNFLLCDTYNDVMSDVLYCIHFFTPLHQR